MKNPENLSFYERLDALVGFEFETHAEYLSPIPEDWVLIMSDVVSSTSAIESGRYKDVNTAGCLALVAIANFFGHMGFPFVFGGDGMTVLVPSCNLLQLRALLWNVQQQIALSLELDLRIAVFPMAFLKDQKSTLRVGKQKISNFYNQAFFEGDGLDFCEGLLKGQTSSFHISVADQDVLQRADFMGYSCRWKDIPSPYDETLAIILKPRSTKSVSGLFDLIEKALGQDYHPLSVEKMSPRGAFNVVGEELRIFGFGLKIRDRLRLYFKGFLAYAMVMLSDRFGFKMKYHWIELDKIREYNQVNSDYRKYDGALKIIAATTTQKRKDLMELLEQEFLKGQIFYGVHASDRAHMTCVVHVNAQTEVHFIDAADGGYAMAAIHLKQQIKNSKL
jgi:hypothetical protein